MQSQVTFNRVPERVPEKVPEKVPGSLGAKPSQVQQACWEGSGEGCGEGPGESRGGFGAGPGHIQQGAGEGLGGRRMSWEALVQSQVRFNRVPEKVPEKVWEALVQSQVGFNRICGHSIHGNPAEVSPALGFAARFRKICKNKRRLQLLGIPPKLILLKFENHINFGTSATP